MKKYTNRKFSCHFTLEAAPREDQIILIAHYEIACDENRIHWPCWSDEHLCGAPVDAEWGESTPHNTRTKNQAFVLDGKTVAEKAAAIKEKIDQVVEEVDRRGQRAAVRRHDMVRLTNIMDVYIHDIWQKVSD